MSESDICSAVREYFEAWNLHDSSALGATLSTDAVLQDWNVCVTGLYEVLKANSDIFQNFPEIRIVVDDLLPCLSKRACACEITVCLNNEAKTELKVLDVIRLDASLKVTSVRAYKL